MSFFPGAPAVKPYPDPSGRLRSTAPVFITKGERNALMGFYPGANQELLPGRLPASFRCRFDAMPAENICDGAASNVVPKVEERTLDPTISPSAVFFRHPHYQPLELVGLARPPWLPVSATVVFLRDQSSVPVGYPA